MGAKQSKPASKLPLFYWNEALTGETSQLEKSNQFVQFYAPHFPVRREPLDIKELKHTRRAVRACIGNEIAKLQYPKHGTTQPFKQLVVRLAPLIKNAPKFFDSFKSSIRSDDASLGYYNFLEDKAHLSRIALECVDSYFQTHGDFYNEATAKYIKVEQDLVEIARLFPRVRYDFDDPDVDHLTGMDECYAFLDQEIDSRLTNYEERSHDASTENETLDFHRHLAKNASYNSMIKTSNYLAKESDTLKKILEHYFHWYSSSYSSDIHMHDETDLMIAHSFVAFYAIDRATQFNWRKKIIDYSNPNYIWRVLNFVLYLKHARYDNGKRISLRHKRSGGTNKELTLYPSLIELGQAVANQNIETTCENALRLRSDNKVSAELLKFMGNIFGVLTCWEGYENDINLQMMSYCENRRNLWGYKSNFIRKLLRLDYDQMNAFLDDLGQSFSQHRAELQQQLDNIDELRG